jgi:hypothetical protein
VPLEIPFPAANDQGVVVIRCMVIAPVGGGKTTLMGSLAPEFAPKDRWEVVGPVNQLAKRVGLPPHQIFGRDHDACEKYFGGLIRSGRSCLLLIDEFDEFCPGGVTGASGGYSCESLYRILNYARNEDESKLTGNEIAVFVSSRGTADITTNSIRTMDVVFFAEMWEGNAVKYLRASVRQGSINFEKIVRNLPKYVFMVWCPQAGGFRGFLHVHPELTWGEWDPDSGCDGCDLGGIGEMETTAEETPEEEDDTSSKGYEPPSEPSRRPPESSSTRTRGRSATAAGA